MGFLIILIYHISYIICILVKILKKCNVKLFIAPKKLMTDSKIKRLGNFKFSVIKNGSDSVNLVNFHFLDSCF